MTDSERRFLRVADERANFPPSLDELTTYMSSDQAGRTRDYDDTIARNSEWLRLFRNSCGGLGKEIALRSIGQLALLLTWGRTWLARRARRNPPDEEKNSECQQQVDVAGRFARERHDCPRNEHHDRGNESRIHFDFV